MKYAFTIILLFITSSFALSESVPPELIKLQDERNEEISKINAEYLIKLEKLKVIYTKKGDLDSAIIIRDEINRIKNNDAKLDDLKEPPVVVSTWPDSGNKYVDSDISEIRVTFSKTMANGWSWCTSPKGKYPETTGKPKYIDGNKTCILPVKLEPKTRYAIRFNIDGKYMAFKDTNGIPVAEYLLEFKTK